MRRPVEYDQAVHRPRLGHVVEQRQVRVRHERVQDLAVSVHAVGFADEGQRGGQRTHHDVVDHPVPAQPQEGLSHPRKVQERRYGPYVPRRGFPGDDLLQTRVAKLLQVHRAVGVKVVDDVRLVALADRVEVDGAVLEPQRQPAVDGVYGHHEEYANDVPLQPRHPVVLEVLRHLVEGYWHGEEDKHPGDEPGDECAARRLRCMSHALSASAMSTTTLMRTHTVLRILRKRPDITARWSPSSRCTIVAKSTTLACLHHLSKSPSLNGRLARCARPAGASAARLDATGFDRPRAERVPARSSDLTPGANPSPGGRKCPVTCPPPQPPNPSLVPPRTGRHSELSWRRDIFSSVLSTPAHLPSLADPGSPMSAAIASTVVRRLGARAPPPPPSLRRRLHRAERRPLVVSIIRVGRSRRRAGVERRASSTASRRWRRRVGRPRGGVSHR